MLSQLSAMWMAAKAMEEDAVEKRRQIEDQMKELLKVEETLEGTMTVKPEGYEIKIVGRIDRKVDGDKVQELAAEHGLTEHLSKLFRWKPEINAAAWKAADQSITNSLSGAITSKPGRPSFKIIIKE